MKFRAAERDQLANCMLLSWEEMAPEERLTSRRQSGLPASRPPISEMHLIPKDKELWQSNMFEDFIEARKELLRDKFRRLGVLPGGSG